MVFVATAASIVSGTVAERVRFWPFMTFTLDSDHLSDSGTLDLPQVGRRLQ